MQLTQREDILVKIAQGAQSASSMLPHLDLLQKMSPPPQQKRPQRLGKMRGKTPLRMQAKVLGNIPMPVIYAKCCKPDTCDCTDVEGVIGRSGDVRVHCLTCKMLRAVNPERKMKVKWVPVE